MKAEWLADVLRAAGLTVHEVPGWRERGKSLRTIHGVVAHHTATGPKWNDSAVVDLLVKGRPDVPGPLSQLGLRRDGSYDLIAAGRSNHNGYGTWGNDSIGIEAYNDGIGEMWPSVQVDAYERGAAAILRHLGLSADKVLGHRETDPKRKIDPAGIDMPSFRSAVATLIDRGTVHPPTPPEEDPLMALTDAQAKKLADDATFAAVQAKAAADSAARAVEILEGRPDKGSDGKERPAGKATGTLLGRIRDGLARIESKG